MVSLYVMYRYQFDDILKLIPIGEAISSLELPRRCRADEGSLARLVQHAMTKRFLAQPGPGLVTHTAFSAIMVARSPVSDLVGYVCEDLRLAAACIPDALKYYL